MSSEKCPQCGAPMDHYEKDTSSGRDIRTYHCTPCDRYVDVDAGIATWKAISDDRDSAPAPFPPPSATDAEIRHDLAIQGTLVEYGRRIFAGGPTDPAFESCALTDELRCDNLNLAWVVLILSLEQGVPADRTLAAMDHDLLAPNLGQLARGIVALSQQFPGLGESQYSSMMRDGSFAYRSLLAPVRGRTAGSVFDCVREIASPAGRN